MIINCNAYTEDSIFYDDWNQCVQSGDIEFYRSVVKHCFAGKKVLELACGTGRILGAVEDLISHGIGIDRSDAMLEIARQKYADSDKLRFQTGDMTAYCAQADLDTVLCGYNSLQHLLEDAEVDGFFRSCHTILKHDGILIVDIFQPDHRFLSVVPEHCQLGEFRSAALQKTVSVSEIRHYDPSSQINHITTCYSYDGHCCKAEAAMRQFFSGTLERFAEKNHFSVLHKYGNYQGEPFGPASPKQIYIFKKEPCDEACTETKL